MAEKHKTIQYLTDSPARILFSICFPLILVNLVLAATTTLTNWLYSRFVGPDAFAVMGYLSAFTTAFANIIGSVVSAAWIKTAHVFGAGDPTDSSRQMCNGFAAIALVDLALMLVLLLFCEPILSLLHIPPEIAADARIYYILNLALYLPVAIAALFLTVVNGTSNSSGIFWINIVVVFLNFLAAALLLAGLKLGMVGLALAGSLGAVFQLAFDLWLFRKRGYCFSLRKIIAEVDWPLVRGIIRYGVLIAAQNLLCTVGYLLVTFQTNRHLSMDYISVLNVSLPLMGIMSAISSACMAFCPPNHAAGENRRLKQFIRLATLCCMGYGVLCFLLYISLGDWYFGRLFSDGQIITHGKGFWFWYGLGHIALAGVFSIRSFFDSVGLSRLSLFSGLGELLGNLLCAFILIPCFGKIGRSLSYPMGWFFAAVFLLIALLRTNKENNSPTP